MNDVIHTFRPLALRAISAAAFTPVAAGAYAQDTTSASVRHGEPRYQTTVKNSEIVYLEGNDLVLRLENGRVEHRVVPSEEKFTIGGKELTVSELRAGTRLT
jgi:hypothetical protein